MGFLGKLHRDLRWRGGIATIKHNFEFYIPFRHKIDQEIAMWLNMVEALQCAQPQRQNPDHAIPKDVPLVK